jgi:hypothetical protein
MAQPRSAPVQELRPQPCRFLPNTPEWVRQSQSARRRYPRPPAAQLRESFAADMAFRSRPLDTGLLSGYIEHLDQVGRKGNRG